MNGSLVATSTVPFGGGTATVEYQHTDALGTPVAVTNASKAVIQRSEYEPYGAVLNRPIQDAPGFTGHVEDAATGLTYMQQRYYDPLVGRFLSVDPVTTDGATGGNFNRYWYANNNPYKFTDPDGRATTCNQKECRTTADSFNATKSQGRTIVASADEKEFVDSNKDAVRARTGPEKMAVLTSTNGELALTNRTTGDANATVRLLNGKLPEGAKAITHGHTERGKDSVDGFVDAPEKNGGYGDSAPLAYGVPGATVFGSNVAWREMVGGQLTMTYPVGSVNSTQLGIIQANLNSEQLLFQSK